MCAGTTTCGAGAPSWARSCLGAKHTSAVGDDGGPRPLAGGEVGLLHPREHAGDVAVDARGRHAHAPVLAAERAWRASALSRRFRCAIAATNSSTVTRRRCIASMPIAAAVCALRLRTAASSTARAGRLMHSGPRLTPASGMALRVIDNQPRSRPRRVAAPRRARRRRDRPIERPNAALPSTRRASSPSRRRAARPSRVAHGWAPMRRAGRSPARRRAGRCTSAAPPGAAARARVPQRAPGTERAARIDG
jgi:hypothetical protein